MDKTCYRDQCGAQGDIQCQSCSFWACEEHSVNGNCSKCQFRESSDNSSDDEALSSEPPEPPKMIVCSKVVSTAAKAGGHCLEVVPTDTLVCSCGADYRFAWTCKNCIAYVMRDTEECPICNARCEQVPKAINESKNDASPFTEGARANRSLPPQAASETDLNDEIPPQQTAPPDESASTFVKKLTYNGWKIDSNDVWEVKPMKTSSC